MLLYLVLAFGSKSAWSQGSSPKPPPRTSSNWTSCETFINNTVFDPDSVLDVDWRIFYFWNPEIEASYNIRFSRPTEVLVDRFRVGLDAEITPSVNWTNAELFMESSIDFSALYLKTNVSGIYRIIPSAAFDFTSIPTLLFGLKVVKQGYLGIANCKYRLCYGLAPVEKMPAPQEEEAARSLGFYSEYNRSHTLKAPDLSSDQWAHDLGDDDDEDLEVDLDPNRLELF